MGVPMLKMMRGRVSHTIWKESPLVALNGLGKSAQVMGSSGAVEVVVGSDVVAIVSAVVVEAVVMEEILSDSMSALVVVVAIVVAAIKLMPGPACASVVLVE